MTNIQTLATKTIPAYTLEDKIFQIQSGDERLRNRVIDSYQPFIKKVISKVCNRFIDHSMDEYSIGLFAFNEAINQYQEGQGSKFLTFADMVIRRRIIDFIRKESRQAKTVYMEQPEVDEEGQQEESYIEQRAALDHYEEQQRIEERLDQIESYQSLLLEYDITFKILSKHCPKHIDARENAKQVAKILVEDKKLANYLKEKKQLPIKELLQYVSCSRKTIERNRKYIIAVSLIYLGGYTALQPYIEPEAIH
ncbi:RNA polymerase sigma-I factor [Camelliibacillus cellulosilyticus]|uniref:RNA polymerase sigma factor SigI n=1 Tax=Camelliibacillus cellulosilyticus TaxID=2174486 RepID=A0ABV9GMJ3_9BACL